MSQDRRIVSDRWAAALAVVLLFLVCALLLSGQIVAAENGPSGPNSPQGTLRANPGFTVDLTSDAVFGLVNPGDVVTTTRSSDGAYGTAQTVRMDANYAHDWVHVGTQPGARVTVTVEGKGTVIGDADGGGDFFSFDWPWSGDQPDIAPGDVVSTTAAGLTTSIDPVGVISGELDLEASMVSGAIMAPWFTSVTVVCEVWEPGAPRIEIPDVPGNGGTYDCNFAVQEWQIEPGQDVAVRYLEPDGDSVINVFQAPWARVNYAHDWVGVDYPAGHTIWVTVTDDVGVAKGYAQFETVLGGGWSGDGGETREEDWQGGRPPDIVAYDWAHFLSDDGYRHSVRVGEIDGALDLVQDTVEGTITADWFAQTLDVRCEVWVENGPPGIETTAEPNGGSYTCDFGDVGWDLEPGQDVSVRYREPDDVDRVINVFREPVANMRVEKWVEGDSEAAPGGPVVFSLRYANDGEAEATTVLLTDSLPLNTTYFTDSSGFSVTDLGNQVVWTFGPVPPRGEGVFQLVLDHTAGISTDLENEAEIWTEYDDDEGNNNAGAQVHVGAGEPDLYVGKHADPGDPVAGQTFLYRIEYGNNGPVASGSVLLTDTLPEDTSIIDWFSENGYGLWVDHSTAEQLILEAPTLPGNWGDRIYLRLEIDPGVAVGTQLTNEVEIATANSYAWDMRNDVWVGRPRTDFYVDKHFGWGQLTPGGEVGYGIHLRNGGNVAAQAWLTDELPIGMTFDSAWRNIGQIEEPFPPDYVDDEIAVWDLGVLEPGEWRNINIRLFIEDGTPPGTVLNNCAIVAIDGDDAWPEDNTACVEEMVYEPGPNLRIYKQYEWQDVDRIRYELFFENLGSVTLEDVVITDMLPGNTSFNGNWWHDFRENIDFVNNDPELTWTVSRIEPGWSSRINFEVELDPGIVGDQGLPFGNTAEAPIPGDVNPADNYAEVTAYTGPDVYVEKWVSGGVPLPGEILTFTVKFGNHNQWPWGTDDQYGSHLTDTLPLGMTFITATAPWNPDEGWPPEKQFDNTIVWGWGNMGPQAWWHFDLAVEISDTVQIGDLLVNKIEAFGDSPDDIDYDYDNNAFELPVIAATDRLYLPVVLKGYVP